MNKVTSLDAKRKKKQQRIVTGEWLSGEGICCECEAVENTVAPVGTGIMECGSCGEMAKIWRYPITPQDGVDVLQCLTCNRSTGLFTVMAEGCMCATCGTLSPLPPSSS